MTPMNVHGATGPADHHRHPRDRRRGRRRAGRLDRRSRRARRLSRAGDLGAGRRAAHRRDHLLRRAVPQGRRAGRGPRSGARADAGAGRRRHRARLRADGGGARRRARLRHARPHDADRLDAPRLRDDREDRARRRPRRSGGAARWMPSAARQVMVAFDMAAIADATGSLISAVLFGALAGSGALPFPRMAFEAAIRRGGVGVDGSLAAFDAGFEAASAGDAPAAASRSRARCAADRAECCGGGTHFRRAVRRGRRHRAPDDYQDRDYAEDYLRAARATSATSSSGTATAPTAC